MADLSQIKIGGVLYDIKDATARENEGIELDTEMSDTSTNGVQNCIVKAYVDNSVKTEVTNQIETQVQNSIQETVQEEIEKTLSGGSEDGSGTNTDDEIDSWFQ